MFGDPFLREQLRFRGGTALNKLHFPQPLRYSEDIDLTRTTAAGLCRDHPQKPGLGIYCRGHPGSHPARRHAAANPALHRRHTRQAAGRSGPAEEGRRHRGEKRVGTAALLEAGRVAGAENLCGRQSQNGGTMNYREAHKIWIEQYEAAETVRARFGLKAVFDYIVGEKLINFAEAASCHHAFAHELPRSISEVRRMFTPQEITAHLTRIERERNEKNEDVLGEDDSLCDSPATVAKRV